MTPHLRMHLAHLFATKQRRIVSAAVALLILAGATIAVRAALQGPSAPVPQLAAILPQGALLTIESKDFAGLLKRWNDSPESAAWLKSTSYSVFSNSRLYGRLGDAQNEFAKSAGLPPDAGFLKEVAGDRSVFAWYDIGKLEFLYITHMPSGSADKTRLVQMRGKFARRQIGSQTFYVRTLPDPNGPSANPADPNQPDQQPDQSGQPRTVAFASSGDWLLLATREDLMAGALTLLDAEIAKPTTANPELPKPLSQEPWFTDSLAAAAKDPGDLRMTLNLEKIVPTPYFRSYWIQHNITDMKQYRSAVADLYTDAGTFREERVLLSKSPQENAAATSDLAAMTQLVPDHAGVYRAHSAPSVEEAIASLDEKLLQRATGTYTDTRIAPDADVSVQTTGPTSDLETRIDAAPLVAPTKVTPLDPLKQTLTAANLSAIMTVSRTGEAADGIWVPFHSAVVLASAQPWDQPALQSALQHAVGMHLTASNLGLVWKSVKTSSGSYSELNETRPLEIAVRGKLCILTDDPALMQQMLARASGTQSDKRKDRKAGAATDATAVSSQATLIAGFDLTSERAPYARWTALTDGTNSSARIPTGVARPAFFSESMHSLADTFADLQSERIVERRDGPLTRQTVTYAWQQVSQH